MGLNKGFPRNLWLAVITVKFDIFDIPQYIHGVSCQHAKQISRKLILLELYSLRK